MIKKKIDTSQKSNFTQAKEREFPKYTTQLMNLANQNSQATRPKNVGQLSDLISEINPDSLDEWKAEYTKRHPDAVEEATEKVLNHIENLVEALSKIDENMVKSWIEELIFEKTASGLITEKTILKKLADQFEVPYRNSTCQEESEFIDGYLSNVPVQVKPESYKANTSTENEDIDVHIIYYKETNKYITIYYEEELENLLRRQ